MFLVGGFTCGLFCGADLELFFGPPLGSEMEGDHPPPLRRYPSVLDMGKVVAVEFEGETGLFHRRLILRTASTATMLNTTGRMCDSPNGLFWILTPDGDVYLELFRVPPATGIIWLNERNEPIPTTMMPAGRHLEQVYEFGAHRRLLLSPAVIVRAVFGAQETEDTCREGESRGLSEALTPPATSDTAPVRKVDEGDSVDPGDTVADPLLDARVLSVQRNSEGDRHREFRNAVRARSISVGWMARVRPSNLLLVLQIFERTRMHPLAHHSRFVQLSGLLSTDPAAQEHELLVAQSNLG